MFALVSIDYDENQLSFAVANTHAQRSTLSIGIFGKITQIAQIRMNERDEERKE